MTVVASLVYPYMYMLKTQRRTPTRNQSKTANAHLWSIHPPKLHNLINQVEPELQEKAKAMKPVPQVFYYNKGL